MAEISADKPTSVELPTKSLKKTALPQDDGPPRMDSVMASVTGFNMQGLINDIIKVEQRRIVPVEERRQDVLAEMRSYKILQEALADLNTKAEAIANKDDWNLMRIESSNQEVLLASQFGTPKTGNYTVLVEQLALNHQLGSQMYAENNTVIGEGTVVINVDEEEFKINIDSNNNTLKGLASAINNATEKVRASVINTGETDTPYQFILTSTESGETGRMNVEVSLRGGEEPFFGNTISKASDWSGVPYEARKRDDGEATTSTAVVRSSGTYTGDSNNMFTFEAVDDGAVAGDYPLTVRWKDEQGRSGKFNLDKFSYAPGSPIDIADGVQVAFSSGELVGGEKFSISAKSARNPSWWESGEDGKSAISQPTLWYDGALSTDISMPDFEIAGEYKGSDKAKYTFTVSGTGQVGEADDLTLNWTKNYEGKDAAPWISKSENSGSINVGRGYRPGRKLAIDEGLRIALPDGVLVNNAQASFTANPRQLDANWWLPDEERGIPPKVTGINQFVAPEDYLENPFDAPMVEFPQEIEDLQESTSLPLVGGSYTGDKNREYTFNIEGTGTVGITNRLRVRWSDDAGNEGVFNIGKSYKLGQELKLPDGINVSFGYGRVYDSDSFTFDVTASSIQPPQDARIRLGSSGPGTGTAISSSSNEFYNAIEGLKLEVLKPSDEVIRINVDFDRELASEKLGAFTSSYNQFVALSKELSKFDPSTDTAGPLLGSSDLMGIQEELSMIITNPIPELSTKTNMLASIGLDLSRKADLKVNDKVLGDKLTTVFNDVGKIFYSRGITDNDAIQFAGMDSTTEESLAGYSVNVTRVAKKGYFESGALPGMIKIDGSNNSFRMNLNGQDSGNLSIAPGLYSLDEYAQALSGAIGEDKTIGSLGAVVQPEGQALRITSNVAGSRSVVGVSQGNSNNMPPGFGTGITNPGQDVAGTIGGEAAQGIGNLLRGKDSSRAKGLRLLVRVTDEQLGTNNSRANVKVVRGVGSKMNNYLSNLLQPQDGGLAILNNNYAEAIDSIDEQIKSINERIQNKKKSLIQRFSRLETNLASLKEQQRYLSSQLANLPKAGGGSPIPGL